MSYGRWYLRGNKIMDLDKKIGIKENLVAEVGEQEAEMIWDRAKSILKEIEA